MVGTKCMFISKAKGGGVSHWIEIKQKSSASFFIGQSQSQKFYTTDILLINYEFDPSRGLN